MILARLKESLYLVYSNNILLIFMSLVLVVYMAGYHNSHPYNTILWPGDYFIRNWLLLKMHSGFWIKLLFFIPVAMAVMDLINVSIKKPMILLILLASLAFFMPSWLIEQRYYLPTFFFLLLFLPSEKPVFERATLIQSVFLACLTIYGIHTDLFYL